MARASFGWLVAVALGAAPCGLARAQEGPGRWPQPVRVGDLRERLVIEPSNRQGSLGRVSGVSRQGDGALVVVVRLGGVFGLGTRTVGVPIGATALLGPFVQVVDLDAAQLKALPEWSGAAATALAPDDVVRIGLNRN